MHIHTLCYDNLTQIIRNTLPIQAASGRTSWDVRPLKARPRTHGITCVGEHSGVQTGGGDNGLPVARATVNMGPRSISPVTECPGTHGHGRPSSGCQAVPQGWLPPGPAYGGRLLWAGFRTGAPGCVPCVSGCSRMAPSDSSSCLSSSGACCPDSASFRVRPASPAHVPRDSSARGWLRGAPCCFPDVC